MRFLITIFLNIFYLTRLKFASQYPIIVQLHTFTLGYSMIEISDYLKAPDALGETTPAAGTFSVLKRTAGVTESDLEEVGPIGFNDPRYFTYHGIEACGALSFADQALTVASVTYWYHGVKYTTATPTVCDLDLTADRDHLTAVLTDYTQYYMYFKDSSGKLYWSPTAWDLKDIVPVALVHWNGTEGCVQRKTHNHTRDLDWHINSSKRLESGLDLIKPAAAFDDNLQIGLGVFYDADLKVEIDEETTCRVFYLASAGLYTSVASSLPYAGTSGIPQYLCTSGNALQAPGSTEYVCYWVYATSDITTPIYVIPTHAATAHLTLDAARAEAAPPVDWLLLTRYIYTGDGEFVEAVDPGNLHVPANSITDSGKVLTAGASAGTYTWEATTHPTGDGNLHVPANSTTNSGKVLTAGASAGTYTWETPSTGATLGDVIALTIALGG